MARRPPPVNHQVVETIPAPTGGLNIRDPLSAMAPTDCYDLQNWVPQQFGLKMRKGYAEWKLTSASETVKTVMSYFPQGTSFPAGSFATDPTTMPGKMFAATDANIYDVTTAGIGGAVVSQALSGTAEAGRFTGVNFSNAAGNFLLACSEADGYYTYDGAVWLKVTLGGGAGQIAGVDPVKFAHVALWKNRAWFIEKNTCNVWYTAVDSLYGTVTKLPLGSLFRKGGSLAWTANWTIDAGEGIDDFIVFCSTNGEIIVYKGTDPSSTTTFSLVGRWEVGIVPVGRRGYCMLGGDLLILSSLGITPVSFITRGGAALLAASQKEYTSKISRKFNEEVTESFTNFGWQLHVNTREGLLVVTLPDSDLQPSKQYAMTISNGSWTRFFGLDMQCVHEVAGWSFFGAKSGFVYIGFIGNIDNQPIDPTSLQGSAIQGVLQPAFHNFGQGAQLKHFLLAKINFLASRTPALQSAISLDFRTSYPLSSPAITSPGDPGVWDVGLWDSSVWDGDPAPLVVWQSIPGVGYYGSLTLLTSSTGELILTDISYVLEKGNVI